MAELSGKVGAIYAAYGAGTLVENASVTLSGGEKQLTTNKNVIVSKVTVAIDGLVPISNAWYCTVRGLLVVTDGGSDEVFATYRYWTEGTYGNADKIGIVGGFFNWSINLVGDAIETTDKSDSGHRTYIAGLKGWNGSAEKHWLTTPLLDFIGDILIIKFLIDTTGDVADELRYEGIGVITGHGITSAVDTLVNESISFQGSSVLTYEST